MEGNRHETGSRQKSGDFFVYPEGSEKDGKKIQGTFAYARDVAIGMNRRENRVVKVRAENGEEKGSILCTIFCQRSNHN